MMFSHLRRTKTSETKNSRRRSPVVEQLEARELLSITQLTNGSSDHRWPSLNNQGDYVYSAKDTNGFWQVFKNNQQLTSDNHNNEYASIGDNGDIVYFKDGGSGGIGWQVIRRSAGGSEGTIEFSSQNNFSGAHRDANRFSGIASDGTTISGYNFTSGGFGSTTRRFNVGGVGQLPFDFGGTFSSYNYPDINAQGDVLFAGAGFFNSGRIYKTSTAGPFPGTAVAFATMGRINDNGNIVTVTGNLNSPGSIQILSGPGYTQTTTVGSGSWADINNSDDVIFENTDPQGFRQVYLSSAAKPDLSVTTPTWTNQGLDFGYTISGANLSGPSSVALYWSTDMTFDVGNDTIAYSAATQLVQSNSPYAVHVDSSQITAAPLGSKYLLAVIDPNDSVLESDDPNDMNNVAAVGYDPITADWATSPDPQDIAFTYDVKEAPTGQPFDVAVYRSSSSTFSFSTAIQVGQAFSIPALDTSGLSSVSLGNHTVVLNDPLALHPDPAHEYVFVVPDPKHLYGDPDNTIHEAHYRKFVLGAVVHGFQLVGGLTILPPWETQAATTLRQLGYDQVLPFDWRSTSNDPRQGVTKAEGIMLASEIKILADFLVQTEGSARDVVDLHLIGHSRGAVVISQALQELVPTTDPVLTGGYKIMTMLDPHPANNTYAKTTAAKQDYSASGAGKAFALVYKGIQALMVDPQVVIPPNVNGAELYFQHTPASMFSVFNSEARLNLWGEDSSLINNQSSATLNVNGNGQNLTAMNDPVLGRIGHSEVPLYYVRSVLPQQKSKTYGGPGGLL